MQNIQIWIMLGGYKYCQQCLKPLKFEVTSIVFSICKMHIWAVNLNKLLMNLLYGSSFRMKGEGDI